MIRPIRFDPDRVARLETESWRAYYDRRWLSMARVLVAAHREQFGLSAIDALLATISASRAAVAFAPLEGSNLDAARRHLVVYYRRVRAALGTTADAATLAERELDYWVVHRRLAIARKANPPAANSLSTVDTLEAIEPMTTAFAQLHAALFDSTPEMMRPSAEQRALAAVAVDRISGGYSNDVAADWAQVESHLQQTYGAIAAILNATPSPHLEVVT
jgi:hypothetical protein